MLLQQPSHQMLDWAFDRQPNFSSWFKGIVAWYSRRKQPSVHVDILTLYFTQVPCAGSTFSTRTTLHKTLVSPKLHYKRSLWITSFNMPSNTSVFARSAYFSSQWTFLNTSTLTAYTLNLRDTRVAAALASVLIFQLAAIPIKLVTMPMIQETYIVRPLCLKYLKRQHMTKAASVIQWLWQILELTLFPPKKQILVFTPTPICSGADSAQIQTGTPPRLGQISGCPQLCQRWLYYTTRNW